MATHSTIFAWKIPQTEGGWGATAGITKSQTRPSMSTKVLHILKNQLKF